MVFKRLLGSSKASGGIPLELDTVLSEETLLPGGILRGEVVLRAGDRDVRVRTVNAKLVANASAAVGKSDTVDTDTGDTIAHFPVTNHFTVGKGQEVRVPLRFRLRWETPVSEVRGKPLDGVRLAMYTEVDADGIEDRTDSDPVRIGATPLHETVLDAFAAAGYTCRSAQIDDDYIPRSERQILYLRQGFRLVATLAASEAGRPQNLELYFHSNAVGAEIYVRRSGLTQKDWWQKPPALRYVAAHHEVGHVDFEAKVRQWIDEVCALPEKAVDDRERVEYDLGGPRVWLDT
ncbi:sporulation protein [Streptomyces sp. NBC_00094]|uniref:sporulation protein n=1 Tax=Streptomyces sp. NBC_00094 TaxID=2903620 RepID=UPI00225B4F76|nr:sporulation protein [Streptomyces sp. NBC_00094]MCX5392381.1 sporulation protein [Streptomyces sp. NBC_00094]